MNCWPSGKYVHLLYMYSILGRGSFCFNYCLNSVWHGVISLWHCWVVWKPRFLWQWPSAHLHFLVSCFSFSSWQYPTDSLWGSGLVSLLASQAHQHHGHLTNFWCFWQCGQVPNPAGNEISIFKSWSAEGSMSAPRFLGKRVQWCWFSKNTMDQHQQMTLHPNHHRLWKLNTGLHATWAMSFSTLPPTLGPWFPNEIQNLLSSERTLDHWATVSSSSP